MAAPQLETVAALLENHSLPLLVQQRAGARLLLHKSCRIPYVICQSLDKSIQNDEFFLIPLDNKGFYGAVSRHDEPTNAYATLDHILQQPTLSDSIHILIDNVTPVRAMHSDTKGSSNIVLLPGEVIHIVRNKSCPLLRESGSNPLCCFGGGSAEIAQETVCVRDKSRHLHLDKYMPNRFYIVNQGQIPKMEPGVVYNLQDITQHQGLPKVVCTVSHKQTSRDEITLPHIFRMIKVISDRVLLAYKLTDSNFPHSEDITEVSSYSQELFAIADSSKVNMDAIRDHHVTLSLRRALPGQTISHSDFQEMMRKSSVLPPKLPGRPPTLRLNPNKGDRAKLPSRLSSQHMETVSNTQHNGQTNPNLPPMSHTVKLPTRDTSNRSILKRFSSVSLAAQKRKPTPSMRTILDKLHGKEDGDSNNNIKQRPKKSLRGLEIVHILPNEQPEVLDLRKPIFSIDNEETIPQYNSSTISSTRTSQDDSKHMSDFIHSHYDFLDNHHDSSSSYYSAPCSDGSSYRDSAMSNRSVVRFSDVNLCVTEPSDEPTPPSRVRRQSTSPKRSLRESMSKESADENKNLSNGNSQNGVSLVYNRSKDGGSVTLGAAEEAKHIVTFSPETPTSVPLPDYDDGSAIPAAPINHLDEIKRRFSIGGNGGLKQVADNKSGSHVGNQIKRITESSHPKVSLVPTNPVDELKQKFSNKRNLSDTSFASRESARSIYKKTIGNGAPVHEDIYLSPMRSSGIIKLTD